MILFLLKKSFYDFWDNMLRIALINMGFILLASLAAFAFTYLLRQIPVLGIVVLLGGIACLCIHAVASTLSLKSVSEYESFSFADYFKNVKTALPAGLVLTGFILVLTLLITIIIPFYLKMKSLPGMVIAIMLFWLVALTGIALQFFPAIYSRLDRRIIKAVKKCFIIFFDNTAFCLFSFLHNLFFLVISAICMFLLPGPGGLLLYLDEALRLRLMKYDYLESTPDANRRDIPWEELLAEDTEITGTRSLRSFIFPWKS